MDRITIVFLMLTSILLTSCGGRKGELLTQRIQYDVTISSPEKDLEWWVQNLESFKREQLVNSIITAAKSGKNKVYDVMTYKELSAEEIKDRGTRTNVLSKQREYPPYESYDTLVTSELQLSDITKVRFLEEWYLDEESGMVTKKTLAICPMLESYTETGELRGHLPLYWISFVKKFPLATK